MCLKYFSRDTELFTVEYRVWKPSLRRFRQKLTLNNETCDSFKKDYYNSVWDILIPTDALIAPIKKIRPPAPITCRVAGHIYTE